MVKRVMVNRNEVLGYISQWLHVPVEKLTDETLIGHIDGLAEVCCFTFMKTVYVNDVKTFTVGDLVHQLTR